MATLAALLADVYNLTNRPDLVNESTAAVKAATLKAHRSDFFPRDIVTGSNVFASPTAMVQTFSTTLLTRWRAWSYLQNFDPLATPQQPANAILFDIITPNNLFDQYNIFKQNVAWQVGNSCNLRSSYPLATLYYGFYQNPDIQNAANMGWVSDDYPYAIIYEAARVIFKGIGWDQEAAEFNKLSMEKIEELRMSAILSVGM